MTTSIMLISGSTRAGSTNSAALRAAASVDTAVATCSIYDGLSRLPHFNPDDEEHNLPDAARDLRDQIAKADAVLISTPEYAGAMPGALKNLLEWTIGSGSLYGKPTGWINVSPRPGGAHGTYESLRVVLGYAGADIVEEATATIPVNRAVVDAHGFITDPALTSQIHDVVRKLAAHSKMK